jgi:curved DNA-binding protein CbpA
MTQPSATGTLGSTPFCELLVYALSQNLSGSLVFECPDRSKHALLLAGGVPAKARVTHVGTRLGQILIQIGCVQPEALREALDGENGELIGQRLFARGAIDQAGLARGLSEQLLRQLGWLSGASPGTAFAYYEGADLLEDWGGEPIRIDPLTGIWRAADAHAPKDRVLAAVHGLADKTLRLHQDARVGRFDFPPRARGLLDVLRVKPQVRVQLEATGLIETAMLHKLLYVLALTRHLDIGAPPLGVVPGAPRTESVQRPKVTPPPGSALRAGSPASRPRAAASGASAARAAIPAAAARVAAPEPVPARPGGRPAPDAQQTGRFLTRDEIESKLHGFDASSLYELLEVPADASAEQIGQAFPNLARRWHPDRLSPEHAELREVVTRVFARMTEASRVLGNPTSRKAYDESLGTRGAEQIEQEQVFQVLRAAEAFQKSEILLKKRDAEGAEALARIAHEGDPDQPEYAALYAWIRARRADASEADVATSLALLKKAIAKQTDNVKIHYYLACVLKLAGQHGAAMREFRHVAERDPNNVDAAREIRLHDMRKGNSKAPPAEPSVFGKFFKR